MTAPGSDALKRELLSFLEGKLARYAVPDDVVFVTEIPHNATGKVSKMTMRQQFKDYQMKSTNAPPRSRL